MLSMGYRKLILHKNIGIGRQASREKYIICFFARVPPQVFKQKYFAILKRRVRYFRPSAENIRHKRNRQKPRECFRYRQQGVPTAAKVAHKNNTRAGTPQKFYSFKRLAQPKSTKY